MRIRYLYKGGRKKALIMSFDDCCTEDRRLVGIFNKYGIKGSFYLNSGCMQNGGKISLDEVKELYSGHEVCAHTLTHPFLDQLPREEMLHEMLGDKRNIEAACGYPVRGICLPNGTSNAEILGCVRACGFLYVRNDKSTNDFKLPADFMSWGGTCHHSQDIIGKIELFKNAYYALPLFHVWGHSFELPRNKPRSSWEYIEDFCDKFTSVFEATVWYASYGDIYDYVTALRRLSFSADRTMVQNVSAATVWLEADGAPVEIKPGLTRLK